MTRPSIGLITNLLSVSGGGVAEAVGGLARALAPYCDATTLGCTDGNRLVEMGERRIALDAVGPARAGYSPRIWQELQATNVALLHVAGLWTYSSIIGLRWGKNRPYLVSPHGMLLPAALGYRKWKKSVAWRYWERRLCERAAVLHATSEGEMAELRAIGLRQPIAIVPNGVAEPTPVIPGEGAKKRGGRTALFLARIHPIKGLPNLLEAWARVRPEGWRLRIVGEDSQGHRSEVESRMVELGLEGCVTVMGPRHGEEKWREYRGADLYILPSLSENFAITVAEALRVGKPVITTRETPWLEIGDRGCGWCVDYGVEPLVAALQQATRLSGDDLSRMGELGREYVLERCSWDAVAVQMTALYRWLLGEGQQPGFVHNV